jgi:hypothetical protein
MPGYSREIAHRVFARELKDATLQFKEGDDQFSPSYVVTPTGAKINRVFMVGTITELDNIGSDTDYFRARITDPTGSIFVYAGQYQPGAMEVIRGIQPPAFVAIIGKPSIFETDDGTKITSIRAESVTIVNKETRDTWIKETLELTATRIAGTANPMAVEHYGDNLSVYKEMLIKVAEG